MRQAVESTIDRCVRYGSDHFTTITHYYQQLHALGLWPPSTKFQELTIKEVYQAFMSFKPCDKWKGKDEDDPECSCSYSRFDARLKQAAEDAMAKQTGLCLCCFRKGKLSHQDGNCGSSEANKCGKRYRAPKPLRERLSLSER